VSSADDVEIGDMIYVISSKHDDWFWWSIVIEKDIDDFRYLHFLYDQGPIMCKEMYSEYNGNAEFRFYKFVKQGA